MTIPEPSVRDKKINLEPCYIHVTFGHLLDWLGTAGIIRRAYHAERERDALLAKLHDSDRIGTHYDGCWDSGPRHYGCAIAEIAKLRARVAELEAKVNHE